MNIKEKKKKSILPFLYKKNKEKETISLKFTCAILQVIMWPSLLQQNAEGVKTRTRPTTSRKTFISLSLSRSIPETRGRASWLLSNIPLQNATLNWTRFLYIKSRRSLSASIKLINLYLPSLVQHSIHISNTFMCIA